MTRGVKGSGTPKGERMTELAHPVTKAIALRKRRPGAEATGSHRQVGWVEPGHAVMIVDGHPVTPLEWEVFQLFYMCSSVVECIEELKKRGMPISDVTLWKWRKSAWWATLHDRHIQQSKDKYEMDLAEKHGSFSKALVQIAEGKRKGDNSAMAAVTAARLYMEHGQKPLIQRSPMVQIDARKQFNMFNVTPEQLSEVLGKLTAEQMIEINQTGRMPEEMLKDEDEQ